jgi:tetratricopeptide (TPR) repeat protein
MRRFLPVVAPLLLAIPASLALAGDPSPVDEAMEAFKAGEYEKAAETAGKVAADDPLYPKAQYLVGESLLARGDAAGAEKAFRAGLEKKAESGPLLAGLGRALTAKGEPTAAEEPIRKALKIDAKDAVAHRALGECLAARGKTAEARKSLEQALKCDPKDPLAARALVEFLLKQKEPEAAQKYAEAHKAADPKGAMGDFLRALTLDRAGKDKEAIAGYEAAIAKDPKFLDAHKNIAILCITDNPVYSNRERTEKAFKHFEKYFELGGKDEELKKTYETIKSFLEGQKRGDR